MISKFLDDIKWLGLGSLATNVLNNKINADAEVKLGRPRTKNSIQTGNQIVDGLFEFMSPSTDTNGRKEEDKSYQEYQAYLKWKIEKEQADEYEDFLKWKRTKSKKSE